MTATPKQATDTMGRPPTGGGTWWRSNKHIGFPPGFVSDVDVILAKA
jgi:hypothetical protein